MKTMAQRGQAAVTDALYFILIVTALSIFLYGFANSYGGNVKQQINAESSTTFATNSLKTILYSSTPREPGKSLSDPKTEVDYLLSIIKEDYYDDQEISRENRKVLGETISSILAPVSDNYDYVFYITVPSENKFVFMYMHLTNFEEGTAAGSTGILKRFLTYEVGNPAHKNFFCALPLPSGPVDFRDTSAKLSKLLSNVGQTSQATARSTLITDEPSASDASVSQKDAQVDLVLWNAAWLGKTKYRPAELFDTALVNNFFNCESA